MYFLATPTGGRHQGRSAGPAPRAARAGSAKTWRGEQKQPKVRSCKVACATARRSVNPLPESWCRELLPAHKCRISIRELLPESWCRELFLAHKCRISIRELLTESWCRELLPAHKCRISIGGLLEEGWCRELLPARTCRIAIRELLPESWCRELFLEGFDLGGNGSLVRRWTANTLALACPICLLA
jgi:hypothetical protein